MTISDWINEISVKFDELGFVPTTLTDEKNEHFVEWFVTEIEQIKESEKLLIEAAKKGVSQRYIELLRENASIRTLLEKFETENTELRARLEKSVELPFVPNGYYIECWNAEIKSCVDSETDKVKLIVPVYAYIECKNLKSAEDILAELKGEFHEITN